MVVPLSTSQRRIYGRDSVGAVLLSARSPGVMDQVRLDIGTVLRRRHGLAADATPDFTVQTQQDLLAAASLTSDIFTILLGAITSVNRLFVFITSLSLSSITLLFCIKASIIFCCSCIAFTKYTCKLLRFRS